MHSGCRAGSFDSTVANSLPVDFRQRWPACTVDDERRPGNHRSHTIRPRAMATSVMAISRARRLKRDLIHPAAAIAEQNKMKNESGMANPSDLASKREIETKRNCFLEIDGKSSWLANRSAARRKSPLFSTPTVGQSKPKIATNQIWNSARLKFHTSNLKSTNRLVERKPFPIQ
jgi:hypothetical protein